jgi:hypothetical protein
VRKALHVDVPQKNGEDWMICGIGQKGQQGGYRPDFGSLLPHYKDTLIPAIRVRRPALGGGGPRARARGPAIQRTTDWAGVSLGPRGSGAAGTHFTQVLIFNGDVDCCVPYKGNEWWTGQVGPGAGGDPCFRSWPPLFCPCAFASQLCLSFGIIYTQRTGPGDDPAAPGPRSAATSSSPGARGRSTRRSRAT